MCDVSGKIWVLDLFGLRRIDVLGATPVWLLRDTKSTSMAYAVGSQGSVYVSRGIEIQKISADGVATVLAGVNWFLPQLGSIGRTAW